MVSLKRHRRWKGIPGGGYTTEVIDSFEVDSATPELVRFSYDMDEPIRGKGFETFTPSGKTDEKQDPKLYGFYYLEVVALSDDVEVHQGRWFTEVEEINPVHLCVGICTFKREEHVIANVECMKKMCIDNPAFTDSLDVYVADNANTLEGLLENSEHVTVFPNRNTGGSGGFTRTLMEAWYRKDRFTHMLFMDDDISFDPKVLKKTLSLLKVMKPEYSGLFIGGSTLHLTSPYYQYEQGSQFKMVAKGVGKYYLKPIENLLDNEILRKIDFCGWTYTCFPLSAVERNGFPLPLFIKGDDGEFSIRNGSRVLMVNGIGVWHEPYEMKHSPHLTYFDTRNKMILRALHQAEPNMAWETETLQKRIQSFIDKQLYDEAEFSLMAIEDFLKGVDFFLNVREDEQLPGLLAKRESFFETKEDLIKQGYNVSRIQLKNPMDFKDRGVKWAIDQVTGNGTYLPKLLQKRGVYTVDFDKYDPATMARLPKIVHWSERRKMGMVTNADPSRRRELENRLRRDIAQFKREYPGVVRSYRERVGEITSLEFWEKHLGLSASQAEEAKFAPKVPEDIPIRIHKNSKLERITRNIKYPYRRRDYVDVVYGDIETTIHKVLRRAHLSALSPLMRDMAKFKDIHEGERCFIVCPGPSLTLEDVEMLKDEWTFGVNSIFNVSNACGWKPNYYVMYDASGYRRQEMTWEFDSFATDAVFLNQRIKQWQKEYTGEKSHGFIVNHRTAEHSNPADRPMRFEKDASVCIYDRGTVTNIAIDIALYMGFKEIYLIGVDHNYNQDDGRRHFMDTEDDTKRSAPPAYHMLVSTEGYQVSRLHSRARKAKIFNSTRGGKLDVFARRKLERVFGVEDKPEPVLPPEEFLLEEEEPEE